MIEDPITLHSPEHWRVLVKENLGKKIFSISIDKTSLALSYSRSFIYNNFIITKVNGINKYQFEEKYVSKEQFILGISESYKEYLEWLLFHPEWLE